MRFCICKFNLDAYLYLKMIFNFIIWQPVLINFCPSHIRITKLSFEPIVGGGCVFTWLQIQGILFFVRSSSGAEWTRGGCALNSEKASLPAEKRAVQQCCFRTIDAHFWQAISSGAWCLPARSWTMHQASASERKNKQSQVAVAEYHTWVTAGEKMKTKYFSQPNEFKLNVYIIYH